MTILHDTERMMNDPAAPSVSRTGRTDSPLPRLRPPVQNQGTGIPDQQPGSVVELVPAVPDRPRTHRHVDLGGDCPGAAGHRDGGGLTAETWTAEDQAELDRLLAWFGAVAR